MAAARPLFHAADVADERMRAALAAVPGPLIQRAPMGTLISCFSDLSLDAREVLRYSAWTGGHSAGLIKTKLEVVIDYGFMGSCCAASHRQRKVHH